jgi:hypothetical protein
MIVNGNYIVVTYIKLGKSAGNQRVNISKVLNEIIFSLVGSSETTREITYIRL